MRRTIGILAHVDAGKTTFSEQVLKHAGVVRRAGRVDHKDAFFDAHPIEKERGITVFSDQAYFEMDGCAVHWLDTPGHVDFSAEMERAVMAMDAAVLVLSAVEGIQSHTETAWKLLEKYNVPVFLFINKVDRTGADADGLVEKLRTRFSTGIVETGGHMGKTGNMDAELIEEVCALDEEMMEAYFAGEADSAYVLPGMKQMVKSRRLFPLARGSALNDEGVADFLSQILILASWPDERSEKDPFLAQVYKVRYDERGVRMCYAKVISGTVRAKDEVNVPQSGEVSREKITELKRVAGTRMAAVPAAYPGDLCAMAGLSHVRCGDRIGCTPEHTQREIVPMLSAMAIGQDGISPDQMLKAFRVLEDEDPQLSVEWDAEMRMLSVLIMGEIQLEVLKEVLSTRFGMRVEFSPCRIRYMETIRESVVGVGHYEPLRHYAEVHIALVPMPRGAGLSYESHLHVDELPLQYQRLIETHIWEKAHKGVLTGSPVTDMKFVLTNGRHHLKHTEGGDFRQATYRAIRQGLMNADSVLLEPVCAFSVEAPQEFYGKLTGEALKMGGDMNPVRQTGEDTFVLSGFAPAKAVLPFTAQVPSMTRGRGIAAVELDHYEECRDAQSVIAEIGYNPEADRTNTPNSVFCAKGAGYEVDWKDVYAHAHLEIRPE